MASSLAFEGVTKRYDTTEALAGIDLTVEPGSFIALVGASGSGKSTLLKTINRLVDPTAGRVLLDGEDVTTRDPTEMRRRMGYVFQGIGLFPHLTVGENIAMGPRLVGEKLTGERIAELLELVDLQPDMASRLPAELSGGQQQRLALARALLREPDILVLDEATSALDTKVEAQVVQNLRRRGCACVVIAHRLSTVRDCDEIIVLDHGKVVERGTHDELMEKNGAYRELVESA